jgi:hypothetical protein
VRINIFLIPTGPSEPASAPNQFPYLVRMRRTDVDRAGNRSKFRLAELMIAAQKRQDRLAVRDHYQDSSSAKSEAAW